jgi:lysophospholipase L1-like esterase
MDVVTAWSAASEALGGDLCEVTVRNVVRPVVSGTGLRVRLTNALGDRTVHFGHVYVGVPREGPALEPGSNRLVTFSGSPEVRLPPGATALSDPISEAAPQGTSQDVPHTTARNTIARNMIARNTIARYTVRGPTPHPGRDPGQTPASDLVRAGRRLAVSVYLRGPGGVLTGRNRATAPAHPPPTLPTGVRETAGVQEAASVQEAAGVREAAGMREPAGAPSYRSVRGDHAGDESGEAFVEETTVWHWLDALTVVPAEPPVRVVAALGDSITTGVGSRTGHGWPDFLSAGTGLAVVNEGVSGGKVLTAGTGRPAEARLTAEVLIKPGITTVIVQAGINDLGAGARAEDLIAAYRRMAAAARAAGVRLVGGTITPYEGAEYHTASGERARQEVNACLRRGGVFDAVADFDAALRDPAHPARLLPAYDSGDHLHPSTAGHHAMATAVPLPHL